MSRTDKMFRTICAQPIATNWFAICLVICMKNDQAEGLRRRMSQSHDIVAPEAKVIGVVSGKGGVGKSVFCVNFSIALSQLKKKVLIIDLDIGMGNIEQLMNSPVKYHIVDWMTGKVPLSEVVAEGPGQIGFISGGNAFLHTFRVGEKDLHVFLSRMNELKNKYDYILFDFGAGVSDDSLLFILAVNQIILITTPEAPALTDGYSVLKMICSKNPDLPVSCVVNQVFSAAEGEEAWRRLSRTAERFIGTNIQWLRSLHHDKAVIRSVKAQVPGIILYPRARYSTEMKLLARSFLALNHAESNAQTFSSFLSKAFHYLKKAGGG
ncbi:MinD/ParA family protein [Sporolactobacillus sp. THM7-7]|nr:MinD/ParA family protein [Sporolactobacillus sp. THM7-7]